MTINLRAADLQIGDVLVTGDMRETITDIQPQPFKPENLLVKTDAHAMTIWSRRFVTVEDHGPCSPCDGRAVHYTEATDAYDPHCHACFVKDFEPCGKGRPPRAC